MSFRPTFFRAAAVCAITSGVTTFLLWALPFGYAAPPDFEGQTALHANPFYMARLWVNFAHVFLALFAYWGAAARKITTSAGLVSAGFICFLIWAVTELMGVTVLIFAQNYTWRRALAAQPDGATRAALTANINAFGDVWDALFFLLLVAFLLGTLFYGLALRRGAGTEKVVGICFLLAVPLTLMIIADGYGGVGWFAPLVTWVYPALQPVSRFLLGVWLWKVAGE